MKKFAGIDLESILGANEVELREIEYKFLDTSAAQIGDCALKIENSTKSLCDNIHNFYSLNHGRLYCMYKTADIPVNKQQIITFWYLTLEHQAGQKYYPTRSIPDWEFVIHAYKECIHENFLQIEIELAAINSEIKQALRDNDPTHVYAFAIANYIEILSELNKHDSKYLSAYVKKVNASLKNCVSELQAIPVAGEEQTQAKKPLLHVFARENSSEQSTDNTSTAPRLTAFLS